MRDKRRLIVFDGRRWYVRRVATIIHDAETDAMTYVCDKPLSNDHARLADVPEVKRLLRARPKAAP